ncbi:MAG: hypothetical protein ABI452_00885 [Candidatus Limnocylindrales bacterium]
MDWLQVGAVWLHTVAFVIAWGFYGILARMILPGLGKSLDLAGQTRTLAAIERRALPFVLLAIVLFVVSGSYLLVVNPQYDGLGSFTNAWATLMLIKHLLVIVLVGLGVLIDYLIRGAADAQDDKDRAFDLRWIGLAADGATGLGALIALTTAAAQLAA